MPRFTGLLISGAFLASISAVALAQTTDKPVEKSASDDRFIYEQVDEGILRLDSRTGEVSLCGRQDTGWACRLVADEQGALSVEIDRLERENTELRKQLADRGIMTGSAEPKVAGIPEKQTVARSADTHLVVVNNTVEFAGRIWRRLVEMMANVKSDLRRNS